MTGRSSSWVCVELIVFFLVVIGLVISGCNWLLLVDVESVEVTFVTALTYGSVVCVFAFPLSLLPLLTTLVSRDNDLT